MDFHKISLLLSHPTWDVIALFLFIAFGFFYGLTSGKTKITSFILSLYVGGFIFENFDYLNAVTKGRPFLEIFTFRILAFMAIVVLLNILFSGLISGYNDSKKWWQIFILSFSGTGLLFSYLFHLFPAEKIFDFSPVVENVFASSQAFFWWLIIPLIAIFFARK